MGLFDRDKDKQKKADFSNVQSGSSVTPPETEAPSETYTVASGDTLWAIAQRFYGNGNQWNRIYQANKDTIEDPDLIQPGWILNIPRDADTEAGAE